MGIAANKDDLYEKEEVEDNEGEMLAKELGAIFQRTSAKNEKSPGINNLFEKLGKKIMDPSLRDKENIVEEVQNKGKSSLQLNEDNNNNKNEKNKGCC